MTIMLFGPGDKVLTEDEETIEVVEAIEEVYDYSDLDDDDNIIEIDDLII